MRRGGARRVFGKEGKRSPSFSLAGKTGETKKGQKLKGGVDRGVDKSVEKKRKRFHID
ncbi:MAG: hypothetical protein ACPLSK_03890 [bacterium]